MFRQGPDLKLEHETLYELSVVQRAPRQLHNRLARINPLRIVDWLNLGTLRLELYRRQNGARIRRLPLLFLGAQVPVAQEFRGS